MKHSLVGTRKLIKITTRTLPQTHRRGSKKKKSGRRRSTKNKIQINVLLQQLPILFPCTFLSALYQCHCLRTVSHSLFILALLFIHLFSPSLLFHNPDEKSGESTLKIFRWGEQGGRWGGGGADECWQHRCREMKRDADGGGEGEGERKREKETLKARKCDMFP